MAKGQPAYDPGDALYIADLAYDIDIFFLTWAASLVLFMQAGFAIYEVGHSHAKCVRTVILKNLLENATGALGWLATGFALRHGAGNGFIAFDWNGTDTAAVQMSPAGSVAWTPPRTMEHRSEALHWVFIYGFASAAATVVSGAMNERTCLFSHVLYAFVTLAFTYPVAGRWVWGEGGWLNGAGGSALIEPGVIDLSGSGVVHVFGGAAALVGAAIAGPRLAFRRRVASARGLPRVPSSDGELSAASTLHGGRAAFRSAQFHATAATRPTLMCLGAFIMWFCFYGFNVGAVGGIVGHGEAVGEAVLATTLSAVAGAGAAALLAVSLPNVSLSISAVTNGMIAGLASSAAGCTVTVPWTAAPVGAVAGAVALGLALLIEHVGIDDPVSAGATHLGGGCVGLLAVGLLARQDHLAVLLGDAESPYEGLFYGGGLRLVGIQLLAAVVFALWGAAGAAAVFLPLRACGWLRLPAETELLGADVAIFENKQRNAHGAFRMLQEMRKHEDDVREGVAHAVGRPSSNTVTIVSVPDDRRSHSGGSSHAMGSVSSVDGGGAVHVDVARGQGWSDAVAGGGEGALSAGTLAAFQAVRGVRGADSSSGGSSQARRAGSPGRSAAGDPALWPSAVAVSAGGPARRRALPIFTRQHSDPGSVASAAQDAPVAVWGRAGGAPAGRFTAHANSAPWAPLLGAEHAQHRDGADTMSLCPPPSGRLPGAGGPSGREGGEGGYEGRRHRNSDSAAVAACQLPWSARVATSDTSSPRHVAHGEELGERAGPEAGPGEVPSSMAPRAGSRADGSQRGPPVDTRPHGASAGSGADILVAAASTLGDGVTTQAPFDPAATFSGSELTFCNMAEDMSIPDAGLYQSTSEAGGPSGGASPRGRSGALTPRSASDGRGGARPVSVGAPPRPLSTLRAGPGGVPGAGDGVKQAPPASRRGTAAPVVTTSDSEDSSQPASVVAGPLPLLRRGSGHPDSPQRLTELDSEPDARAHIWQVWRTRDLLGKPPLPIAAPNGVAAPLRGGGGVRVVPARGLPPPASLLALRSGALAPAPAEPEPLEATFSLPNGLSSIDDWSHAFSSSSLDTSACVGGSVRAAGTEAIAGASSEGSGAAAPHPTGALPDLLAPWSVAQPPAPEPAAVGV